MKKVIPVIFIVLVSIVISFGQAPQAIKYQAIARDNAGNPIVNQDICLRISLLKGSTDGTVVYCETQNPPSNFLGLINLEIGKGKVLSGMFTAIDWKNGPFFLKIEMDITGGSNYQLIGTSELLSVPYALYAEQSGDNGNRKQLWSENGDHIYNSNNGMVGIGTMNPSTMLHVNGVITATGGNSGQWNTAYGWGNHAIAGYMTSYTETDPVFIAHPANGITSGNIANWNIAYGWGNHAIAGYMTSYTETDPVFFAHPANGITSGNITSWNTAYGWGNHATAGYLKNFTETDPKVGTITLNRVPKWNGTALTSSSIIETEVGQIGIGTNLPAEKLDVDGKIRTSQAFNVNGSNGINDTTEQITNFDFVNDKLKYRTYIIKGGIVTYKSVESIWLDTIGEPILEFTTCGDLLYDQRDGHRYSTVLIDTQCWMAENMNVGMMINSTAGGYQQTDNGIIEKYCYNNNVANCAIYGGLYEWPEVVQYVTTQGAQGICPDGWHVPTDGEWTISTNYLGGESVAGGKMKSTGTIEAGTGHWYSPNTGATNESGFIGLPEGFRSFSNGTFSFLGSYGFFWSSSQNDTYDAWLRLLHYNLADVSRYFDNNGYGLPVRCLKGCSPQPSQSDAGLDQLNIPGTSTNLAGNTPEYGTGLWNITNGTGGTITDPTNPTTSFYGLANNSYTLKWTISNDCGSNSDDVVISFSSSGFTCEQQLVDARDGQSYNTVQIGTQCWMAENMNVGMMINSTASGYQQTDNGIIEKYCYNNEEDSCDIYGGLYEGPEAVQYITTEGAQGICPDGWHVPTDGEWTILTNYLGGESVAGGKMKSTGTIEAGTGLWYSPNTGATNENGFTVLPAGQRYYFSGNFGHLGYYSYFWASSFFYGYAWYRGLNCGVADVQRYFTQMGYGFSVRCLKDDCSPQPSQSDAGLDQLNLPGTTTNLAGNTPEYGTGLWNITNGTGGTITDPTNPTSSFSGLPDNSYTLSWTISNNCGSNYDDVVISFSSLSFTCGQQLVDARDGQSYNTVQIGTQCWMAENMNVGTRIDVNINQTDNQVIEKYCQGNLESYCDIYGGLYQWHEMMQYMITEGAQGICPTDWHIPTDNEWKILEGTVDSQYPVGDTEWDNGGLRGLDAGGNLKEIGTTHWDSPNIGATNESGFTALPAGESAGYFGNLGHSGYFWTSSQYATNYTWARALYNNYAGVDRFGNYEETFGFSVRCLKDDCSPQPSQSDAGLDQLNLPGTTTNLAGNTPEYGTGLWDITNGTGGTITDPTNPTSPFSGLPDNSYTLSWTISNNCGSNYDDMVISFSSSGFTCGQQLVDDRDGQNYNTVQIGTQCWMAENMNVGTKINSTANGFQQTDNGIIEKYCYNNDIANCAIYGGLYEWPEAMQYVTTQGAQGICPDGWHVPTDGEWTILTNYLGESVAGGKMKSTGTIEAGTGLWYEPNEGATNESGFTGLPAGSRCDVNFFELDYDGYFWSSFQYGTPYAFALRLYYNYAVMDMFGNAEDSGFSIRCLKDD
ncbi:MAG: hypothetical protein NT175_10320 [Bacteroidetes bacterium]|nr:hypothetical protein [Bacteroidota bacterium]